MRGSSLHQSAVVLWKLIQMNRGAALALLGLLLAQGSASALPQGGKVVGGQATIAHPNLTQLHIKQLTDRAVINWESFNIGKPEAVYFFQPSSSSAILNRVTGNTPSSIAGQINANGQVMLINPNGILLTPTSQVNVGSFLASTLDMKNADFMAGKLARHTRCTATLLS
mgnify:FL=1